VLVTQASITFHPAKITSRIVDFVFVWLSSVSVHRWTFVHSGIPGNVI
jgi:hypothetical protein